MTGAPAGPASRGPGARSARGAPVGEAAPAGGAAGDDADLRAARRARVFEAMGDAGLDVLVLGRRDDVAYATGARSLWTAGTRPFGAACVLVGGGEATHLLSTWDAGVPPEIPFEHLYGVTWNPVVMARALGAIPGLAGARRVGVDAWSPGFARALGRLAPDADLVPADDLVRSVRTVKLPVEVERIAAACAVARAAVAAAVAALGDGAGPGADRPDVGAARAAALRALAGGGGLVPTTGLVVDAADGPRGPGPIHVDAGVLVDGYEGGAGRTVEVGSAAPASGDDGPAADAQRRVREACVAGAAGADLASAAAGVDAWHVRGSGMGYEPPVVAPGLGAAAVLAPGTVLSVAVEVAGDRRRQLVLVGAAGPARPL